MEATRQARGGVLVAGGGFAGGYVARLLGRQGATIVSPENFMLYTPLLPEAASGTLEPRHVVVPLRQMCPHAEMLLGRVTAIDAEQRTAHVETPEAGSFEIAWDNLVLALGAVARTLPVPGLADHAVGFKDLADAINLRNHVLRELEAADTEVDSTRREAHLTFVFVGAGYAGVEALAELSDLVADALRFYPRLREARQRWVLVDAAPKILPEIPPRLGEYAARELAQRGVEIHVSTTLESLTAGEAVSVERGPDPDAHARLDCRREGKSGARLSSASHSTSADASASTPSCASRDTNGSGRSATARPCRTRRRRAASTRRPASTRSARPAFWRRTWPASRSRTHIGCSGRWRRSAATRESRT